MLINTLYSSSRIKIKLIPRADKKELFKLSQLWKQNKGFLCSVLPSLDGFLFFFFSRKRSGMFECNAPPSHVAIAHAFVVYFMSDPMLQGTWGMVPAFKEFIHLPAGVTIMWFTNYNIVGWDLAEMGVRDPRASVQAEATHKLGLGCVGVSWSRGQSRGEQVWRGTNRPSTSTRLCWGLGRGGQEGARGVSKWISGMLMSSFA